MFLLEILSPSVFTLAENKPEIVDATNPQRIVEILQDEGYRAKLEIDSDGQTYIYTGAGGYKFHLRFVRCEDGYVECEMIVFRISFYADAPISLDAINKWNADNFCQAWIDTEGDPVCDLSVKMGGGVTRSNFLNTVELFGSLAPLFGELVYGEPEPDDTLNVPSNSSVTPT